jgi:poly(3-hydroxybutyrate) depolymerase
MGRSFDGRRTSRVNRTVRVLVVAWIGALATVGATDVPAGQIIDRVVCAADPTQSYALFLPQTYSPQRVWPVIFAFDPGGRGRMPVERYQAAADRYGFIVAGSNNSRNGSPEIGKAVDAMTNDVMSRFAVDPRRVYVAGMSGGSRVAFSVALGSNGHVAGIIASSAGYPDDKVRKTLPFPVFATAGTEDFNRLEMRRLSRALTSAHRLVVFQGGHVWLPSEVAVEAVGWLELQAMKSGLEKRDDARIEGIYEWRVARASPEASAPPNLETYLRLRAIAEDFDGLRDVRAIADRAAALERDKGVHAALKQDDDEDGREERLLQEIWAAEARLASVDDHFSAVSELRRKWKALSDAAKKADDSSERRVARRVLGGLSNSATTRDPDYLKIIAEYRTPPRNR